MSARSAHYDANMRQLRKLASAMKSQEQLNAALLMIPDLDDRKAMFMEMAKWVKFENPTMPLDRMV